MTHKEQGTLRSHSHAHNLRTHYRERTKVSRVRAPSFMTDFSESFLWRKKYIWKFFCPIFDCRTDWLFNPELLPGYLDWWRHSETSWEKGVISHHHRLHMHTSSNSSAKMQRGQDGFPGGQFQGQSTRVEYRVLKKGSWSKDSLPTDVSIIDSIQKERKAFSSFESLWNMLLILQALKKLPEDMN